MHSLLAAVEVATSSNPQVSRSPSPPSTSPPSQSRDHHQPPSSNPSSKLLSHVRSNRHSTPSHRSSDPVSHHRSVPHTIQSPPASPHRSRPQLQLPPPPPLPPSLPLSPSPPISSHRHIDAISDSPQCSPSHPPRAATPAPITPAPAMLPQTPPSTARRSRARPALATPAVTTDPPKKGARVFSASEKHLLETHYAQNKFPTRLDMNFIARSLCKSTDKVRTWYNNRRALDRKLGNNVIRNTPATPGPATPSASAYHLAQDEPHQTTSAHCHTPCASSDDNHPTSHNESSPVEQSVPQAHHNHSVSTPSMSFPRTPQQPPTHPPTAGPFVRDTTATSTAWSALSPDHRPFPIGPSLSPSTPLSPPFTSSASRFRIAPLRIRHVRITIGDTTLHGEIPHDPPFDQGLEVKFLFGKKRIVYEWYCGQDYSLSQHTGGPYAKIEMMFATITKFRMIQGPATTTISMAFSQDPSLYLQTEESIDKFKQRAQQRQYRKVQRDQFPIQVNRDKHVIYMKTDEAVRICNILLEDYPQLMKVFESVLDNAFQSARRSPVMLPRFPEARRLFSASHTFPDLNSRMSPTDGPRAAHLQTAPPAMRTSHSAGRTERNDLVHTDMAGTSRPGSNLRSPISNNINGDPGRVTNSEGDNNVDVSTPALLPRRDKHSDETQAPGTVRRELNFSHLHVSSPKRVGAKRRAGAMACGDKVEGRSHLRRRLSNEAEAIRDIEESSSARRARHTTPARMAEIHKVAVPLRETPRVSNAGEQRSERSKSETRSDQGTGVIRRLPR